MTSHGDDAEGLTIAQELAQLVIELDQAPGTAETAETAVEHAVSAIAATSAGLVLNQSGHPVVAVAADPAVEELYELELTAGTGPVLEAFTARTVLGIDDTAAELRWPARQQAVVRLGLRTELHLPLVTADDLVGVLSLYHTAPKAFTHDDIAIAELIASHTAIALDTARTAASLATAADARRLVGQAMGILMERHDIDEQHAFAILRCYSQETNTKLRDVALQLVETRRLPG